MLPKTPNQLKKIYQAGLSVIAVNPDGPNQVIGHAALYPFDIKKILEIKLYEFGSLIVHPDFRHHRINGLTIGELIGTELLAIANGNPVIATVKRENTLKAFQRLGFQSLPYSQYPMTTSLTCVCPIGGNENGAFCHYHTRKPGEIINGTNGEPAKIACTLMVYNLDRLNKIENRLQQILGLSGQALNNQLITLARQRINQLIVL
jgi:N-acetylglutamate synthase-like GNAT family acetyltransferase